ncbi:putative endo-1,3(4)-beta-glucanase [Aspergillus melleus]|uniref:putative endo-1,3(4)-beta-glucanase n=1 Tax=Aspergillus melleus TaxID=138277 RepID=UPI001E8E0884|nr:uncharacterized protein LDX57_002935 [Aspergillus melleus]KAH8425186.1 hypothetical protein LDX57_002935 [Aspergillus melleus]
MVLDDASPQATMGGGEGGGAGGGTFVPENTEFPIPKFYPRQVRPELVVRPDLFIMAFYPGPWQWRRKLTFTLNRRLTNMEAITERPLTQDEIDAMVTHTSRRVYHERFGAPLGLAQTYNSICKTLQKWDTWRVYYHREGKWVHPVDGFKALRDMAMADSASAAKLLGTVGVRGFFWTLLALTASTMGATFMETLNLAMDPRLADFREVAKNQDPEVKKRKAMEAWKREAAEKAGRIVPGIAGDQTNPGAEQGQQQQEQSASASTSWGSSSPSPSLPPRARPVAEQSQGASFFDDDDASPTAPEYRHAEGRSQGGSAWDRIRQHTMSGSPSQSGQSPQAKQEQGGWNSWQGASSSGSGSGSGYSSSNPDWGRQREREQSQAEFDRLVEAERNAGTDSWSAGKRW